MLNGQRGGHSLEWASSRACGSARPSMCDALLCPLFRIEPHSLCVVPWHHRTCALTGHRCCTLTQQRPRASPPIACGHVRHGRTSGNACSGEHKGIQARPYLKPLQLPTHRARCPHAVNNLCTQGRTCERGTSFRTLQRALWSCRTPQLRSCPSSGCHGRWISDRRGAASVLLSART